MGVFFRVKKWMLKRVALWGLSRDMSGVEVRGGANGPQGMASSSLGGESPSRPGGSVRSSSSQLPPSVSSSALPLPSHGILIIAFAVKGDSISVGVSSLEGDRETLNQRSVKLSWGPRKLGAQMPFIIATEILVTFTMLSSRNEKNLCETA